MKPNRRVGWMRDAGCGAREAQSGSRRGKGGEDVSSSCDLHSMKNTG